MHPPLFQPHPLCKGEVEALVRCHEDHPVGKFFNYCGEVKLALDLCFKEEKKLRKKLNPRTSLSLPAGVQLTGPLQGGGGGGGGATAAATAGGEKGK